MNRSPKGTENQDCWEQQKSAQEFAAVEPIYVANSEETGSK